MPHPPPKRERSTVNCFAATTQPSNSRSDTTPTGVKPPANDLRFPPNRGGLLYAASRLGAAVCS